VLGLLVALCAALGLAVGSFLNVVIWRVPRGQSVVTPRSACPICGAPIRERDNIPVLSWLLLRGRCRDCQAAISARYPLTELGCAALFAATAARFGRSWDLPAYLALFAGLLALSSIDIEFLLLPKRVVYPLTIMVALALLMAAAATSQWHALVVGLCSALAWLLVFFSLNLISPRLLGFGDVRLAPVLGLSLGWLGVGYVLLGFFAANLIGALVGLSLIATRRMSRADRLPYGVFLASGCAVAVLLGPELLRPFTNHTL
jgi:leader peptidase (prepilin peptidase) / N-methyltransferase